PARCRPARGAQGDGGHGHLQRAEPVHVLGDLPARHGRPGRRGASLPRARRHDPALPAMRLIERFCRLLEFAIAVLLAGMVLMVFGNVVLRYAFNSGIVVSEELSRWLFVWVTFLGAIVALKERSHLGTDFLIARLPVRGRQACLVLGHLLMLAA